MDRGGADTVGPAWRASPCWTAWVQEGDLVLSAGADRLHRLAGIRTAVAEAVERLWIDGEGVARLAALGDDAQEVLVLLRSLGVVGPAGEDMQATGPFGLVVYGEPLPAFAAAVSRASGRAVETDGGLTIVVRSGHTARALVADVLAPMMRDARPYVLVDVAYDHTIVVGPLVVPGQTACAWCLLSRVGKRWGDPEPPRRPAAVRDDGELPGMLVGRLLARWPALPDLVERTVSVDLDTLETTAATVFRAPWCEQCAEVPDHAKAVFAWS